VDGEATRPGLLIANRFLLLRQIGRGGSATVWLALDRSVQRGVALKLLHPQFRTDPRSRDRFEREAAILFALQHPRIASALHVDLEGEEPYFAMELVDGRSLDLELGLRAENGLHFSREEILEHLGALTSAAAYAHELGVVHRDLKPTNLILETAPPERPATLKVLDFGVAKLLQRDELEHGTTEGRVLGSFAYMAPEQVEGRPIDHRADLFAIGVIAFEMLTLHRAWSRDEDGRPLKAYAEPVRMNRFNAPSALAARVRSEARPRPSEFVASLGAEMDAWLARALAVDVEGRFQSAEEMYRGLALAFGAPRGAEAAPLEAREASTRLAPTQLVPGKSGRRFPIAIAIALGALAIVTAGIAATIAPFREGNQRAESAPQPIAEPPSAIPGRPDPDPDPDPGARQEAQPERAAQVQAAPPTRTTHRVEAKRTAHSEAVIGQGSGPQRPRVILALTSELDALSAGPANLARVIALGDRIARTADAVPDASLRAKIKRLATSSGSLGDLDGLGQAIRTLEQGLGP
jgi:serine/threonine-protein kinase